MSTKDLYDHLSRMGIVLSREADGLAFDAPVGVLTHAMKEELTRRKQDLLALLPPLQRWTKLANIIIGLATVDEQRRIDLMLEFEERSAILELDAGMHRADADRQALYFLLIRIGPPSVHPEALP